MYCKYCGKEIETGAKYCSGCGKKTSVFFKKEVIHTKEVTDDSAPQKLKEKKSKKKAIIVFVSVLLAIAIASAITCFYFFQPRDVIGKLSESVVLLEVYDDNDELVATGSGYFIYDDKTVVTNYHVITDAYSVTAITNDEKRIKVNTILDYDENLDIAILECDQPTGIPHVQFAQMSELKKGQNVIAIGSPLGIQNTVSTGVISSFDNHDDVMKIHTTAPISSGSSGGLLATESGKAIGVTSASYVEGQNLNIAIDIREVIQIYEDTPMKRISLANFFNSREHLYKYREVSVGEVLNNYNAYLNQKICVVGWISTSLYYEGTKKIPQNNVLFLVNSAEQVWTTGKFPMIPYADETLEYDRASKLGNIIVSNKGDFLDAGKKVKIYGEIDYSSEFHRVGCTPHKIEVLS